MNRIIMAVAAAFSLVAGAFIAPISVHASPVALGTSAKAEGDAALARAWAPVHYQDTDSSDADADFMSVIDFDGDWDAKNNWENQPSNPLRGAAYYSVVETATHWFVTYSFFHPRDWEDFPDPGSLFTHENDLEGALLAVRRDGTQFGALEGMVTVAHTDFYSYTPPGSPYTDGEQDIDGSLLMEQWDGRERPATWQEAKGHGLYAWDGAKFPGGDGVVYRPGDEGEEPSNGDDRDVGYTLTDTFADGGLWSRRDNPETFASSGTLAGDNGADNSANTAWGWDDSDDGDELPRGMMATDPAKLISTYFDGTGEFSTDYTRNPYQ